MIWKNKGHEFEEFKEIFSYGKKIYIYGAGENGQNLLKKLAFADCVEGFIDNAPNKIGTECFGKRVIGFEQFVAMEKDKFLVVIAMAMENVPEIKRQLLLCGYREGKNLFEYSNFESYYLPIYALYAWEKVYVSSVSFLPTTFCNLDCKGCLEFNHANANRKNRDINDLYRSIDALFEKVDYVGLFHISGGEPLLYPSLPQVIRYCNEKYGDRIAVLGITTNGTVQPSTEVLNALKEAEVMVWIDDYSDNVELGKRNLPKVQQAFENAGVRFVVNKVDKWIEIKSDTTETDVNKLIDRCSRCANPFVSLKDGKIYGCNYTEYACEAGLMEEKETDYITLNGTVSPAEIVEYTGGGYTKKGYYSFCGKCNGFVGNFHYIKVAEQYKR